MPEHCQSKTAKGPPRRKQFNRVPRASKRKTFDSAASSILTSSQQVISEVQASQMRKF